MRKGGEKEPGEPTARPGFKTPGGLSVVGYLPDLPLGSLFRNAPKERPDPNAKQQPGIEQDGVEQEKCGGFQIVVTGKKGEKLGYRRVILGKDDMQQIQSR